MKKSSLFFTGILLVSPLTGAIAQGGTAPDISVKEAREATDPGAAKAGKSDANAVPVSNSTTAAVVPALKGTAAGDQKGTGK